MDRTSFVQGYIDACKVAGMPIPDGPAHLAVEQFTKQLRAGDLEQGLQRTMARGRGRPDGSPVTWGPKSPVNAGESSFQLSGAMPFSGVF